MGFKSRLLAVMGLCAVLGAASPALAQSEADFIKAFSGTWKSFDGATSDGKGQCAVMLDGTLTGDTYPVTTTHCVAAIGSAATWSIQQSQIALVTKDGVPIAHLGGNQRRMSGAANDGSQIILERDGGDGTGAALTAARKAFPCYYLGYTTSCATDADMTKPPVIGGQSEVKVLVDLNLRAESRNDASVVSTVKRNTCLPVTQCTVASDGVWCHAAVGDAAGWIKKLSLRQSKWPIVDFANHC